MTFPEIKVDENTPAKTMIKCWNSKESDWVNRFFVCKADDGRFVTEYNLSPYNIGEGVETFRYAKVDVNMDLQFRAFLNVPKRYKWFAINEDGSGSAFQYKPEYLPAGGLSAEGSGIWCTKSSDMSMDSFRPFSIRVGVFPQYKHWHKDILIERES